jgi:hypothetical protein
MLATLQSLWLHKHSTAHHNANALIPVNAKKTYPLYPRQPDCKKSLPINAATRAKRLII